MLSLLNRLLSSLPFDGKKTPLAALSLLLALYAPDIDPSLVESIGDKGLAAWQAASELFLTLAIFHTQLKKNT